MCIQCMAGASVCVGAAYGIRAWLATRCWPSLTQQRMRRPTIVLVGAAVLASGLGLGSAASQRQPSPEAPPAPSARLQAVSR